MKSMSLLCCLLLLPIISYGQESKPEAPVIQDNSFLIEEAYNQEPGVVQHVHAFMLQRNGTFLYTFTQEWPFLSQKHQLSYTLPGQRLTGDGNRVTGVGDALINYRYQIAGVGGGNVSIAPRASLIIPNGNAQKGLGGGGYGYQFNLPVSTVLAPKLVMHWNAGLTVTPNAQNAEGDRAKAMAYNLGHSVAWLTKPNFNVMFETSWNRVGSVIGQRSTASSDSLFLNPGVRWAHNFKNGLQIVPGIAFPIGVGPSKGVQGMFFYLSFESQLFGRKSKS